MTKRYCHCGQPLSSERKTVIRFIGGHDITINNVPVLQCEACQETLYTAKTVKKMDKLIQQHPEGLVFEYPSSLESTPAITYFLSILGEEEKEKILQDIDEPITKEELAYLIFLTMGEVA